MRDVFKILAQVKTSLSARCVFFLIIYRNFALFVWRTPFVQLPWKDTGQSKRIQAKAKRKTAVEMLTPIACLPNHDSLLNHEISWNMVLCVLFQFCPNPWGEARAKATYRTSCEVEKHLVTDPAAIVLFFKSRFLVKLRLFSFTSSTLHIVWSRERKDLTLTPNPTGIFLLTDVHVHHGVSSLMETRPAGPGLMEYSLKVLLFNIHVKNLAIPECSK